MQTGTPYVCAESYFFIWVFKKAAWSFSILIILFREDACYQKERKNWKHDGTRKPEIGRKYSFVCTDNRIEQGLRHYLLSNSQQVFGHKTRSWICFHPGQVRSGETEKVSTFSQSTLVGWNPINQEMKQTLTWPLNTTSGRGFVWSIQLTPENGPSRQHSTKPMNNLSSNSKD